MVSGPLKLLCSLPFVYTKSPRSPEHRQAERHSQAVPNHIQLASFDFLPPNWHLNHGDVSAFSQHKHLYVENPAFGMHVRDDVGERRPREQLEPTLRVFDLSRLGCCEQAQEEVEGVHESIAEE